MDGEIRSSFLCLAQAMTTQSQVVSTQAQAMTTQANKEVGPRVQQSASTMVSCLRDFRRMNPPMFFGSKVNEDTQDFVCEVYKILYSMGASSNEKDKLYSYQLKDVAQTLFTQ